MRIATFRIGWKQKRIRMHNDHFKMSIVKSYISCSSQRKQWKVTKAQNNKNIINCSKLYRIRSKKRSISKISCKRQK